VKVTDCKFIEICYPTYICCIFIMSYRSRVVLIHS